MEASMRIKSFLLGSACLGATFLMPAFAAAQSSPEPDKTDRLQRQIDALQQQLKSLQREVVETKKAAQQATQAAAAPAGTVPAGTYAQAPTGAAHSPAKAPWMMPAGVSLSWGGFIEAAGIWRSRNEVADVASDFNNIPYSFNPLNHENETRFSARQSRLWFQAEGDISPSRIVKAYFEMDFLGAATTANSIESNSYTPRIRQAFVNYDDKAGGWHVVAGQAWSLLTQNKSGIVARQENTPLGIDAQYVVGFNWSRNPQIRVVKDFGSAVSVGVSAESPQVRFQTPGSNTPNGAFINSVNAGTQSGLMDTLQNYSTDTIPDFIEKVAFDPGWGHYEVLGLERFFTDRSQSCAVATTACAAGIAGNVPIGTASNHTTYGWGVGGNVLLPAIPKFLDLQGSVLYGNGIGRYGSGQLPDVTFAQNGSLSPVTALQALVGAVAHFTPDLDVYAYAGLERDNANFSTVTNPIGLGNPDYSDGLCFAENALAQSATVAASSVTGALGNSTCSVNVKQLEEITVGFWQNLYKGDMGRIAGGAQFEYIHRDTFQGTLTPGVLVSPAVDEAVFMTSLRYYFP
jgi:hypothetical protein